MKYKIYLIVFVLIFVTYLGIVNNSKIEFVKSYDISIYNQKYGKQGSGEAWKDCYSEIKDQSNSLYLGLEIPKIIQINSEFKCFKHVL